MGGERRGWKSEVSREQCGGVSPPSRARAMSLEGTGRMWCRPTAMKNDPAPVRGAVFRRGPAEKPPRSPVISVLRFLEKVWLWASKERVMGGWPLGHCSLPMVEVAWSGAARGRKVMGGKMNLATLPSWPQAFNLTG